MPVVSAVVLRHRAARSDQEHSATFYRAVPPFSRSDRPTREVACGAVRQVKGTVMIVTIEIENIDELRRREGIDDIELHEDIGHLRVGDQVRLTFLSGASLRETLPVRITHIRGGKFRGRLAGRVAHPELLGLRADAFVTFTAGQIHSIAWPQPTPAPRKGRQRR